MQLEFTKANGANTEGLNRKKRELEREKADLLSKFDGINSDRTYNLDQLKGKMLSCNTN